MHSAYSCDLTKAPWNCKCTAEGSRPSSKSVSSECFARNLNVGLKNVRQMLQELPVQAEAQCSCLRAVTGEHNFAQIL